MEACQKRGIDAPTWSISGGFVVVTFMRPTKGVTQDVVQGVTQDDTQGDTQGDTQENNLDIWIEEQIRNNPTTTTEELAKLSRKGVATIKRHIAKLPHIKYVGSGSIAYAEEADIKPDKSFALTRYFLQEDTDDVPLIEFEFGKDGKHCLVAHSRLEASRYLPLLKKSLGEDGFSYILPGEMADDDFLGEDDEDAEQVVARGNQPTMDMLLKKMRKEQILHLGVQLWLSLDSRNDVYRLRREYREQVLSDPKHILMLLSNEDANILKAYKKGISEHNAACVGIMTTESHHNTLLEIFGLA